MDKLIVSQRSKGFTIVELLIVVVVIAILAAITIVAYNGIQNRAKNTQVVSATSAYVKGIRAYYTTYGDTLPMKSNVVHCFDGTDCWSTSTTSEAQSLRTELLKVMSTLPTFPTGHAVLVANGSTGDGGGTYSGWYVLYQVTPDVSTCPAIGGTRYLNANTVNGLRTCRAALEI